MPQKLLILFCLFSFNIFYSQVVINEIDADTPGSDVLEFVELKSSTANFSLNGYVLVFYNGGTNNSYFAYDLDGFTTDINGIIHFGNVQVSPAPMGVFGGNSIQNGPDVIALYQANDSDFPFATTPTTLNLIDAVAYATTTSQPTVLMSALGITLFTNENVNSAKDTQSIQRKNDGTYEVKSPTPGANNDGSGIVLNYVTVSTSQAFYTEGDSFNIVFTTSQPVTGSNLIINMTLHNGNFNLVDFTGGLTVSIPVGQSSGQTYITLTDDAIDEGDEEMIIAVQPMVTGYVANNNNILMRIYDNDFVIQSYGTPTNPTYGFYDPQGRALTSQYPLNYYNSLNGLSGNSLKQAVQDIIANPSTVRAHNYGDIYEILRSADVNPENSNQVWQLYLETPTAKLNQQVGSSNIGVWNREHVFPQSRGGFQNGTNSSADGIGVWLPTNANDIMAGHADAHHIRVADGSENSLRSNRNYGVDYNGPLGTTGSWKGDVARSLFYMAVRYNGLNIVNGNPDEYLPSTTTSSGNIGDLATLLAWNVSDPADDFEMNRNNYIYTWQVNRNPFIDLPDLADYIFGANFGQPWSSTLNAQSVAKYDVLVYPNPTSDYIIVSGLEDTAKAEVFSLTGQKVMEVPFTKEVRIPLSLSAGVYLVKISNENSSTTRKIIVK